MPRIFDRKTLKQSLILIVGFTLLIILTFVISWKVFEKQAEADVSNINPKYFPIVAVISGKSEVVLMESLEEYKRNNPNYSFLIPNGKEELINNQLRADQKRRGGKGIPRVSKEIISDGKQLIEFEIIGDGFFLSRYEATDKEVKPLMFKLSGPGFVFFPCGTTFLICFVGYFFLRLILWVIKRKQNVELM